MVASTDLLGVYMVCHFTPPQIKMYQTSITSRFYYVRSSEIVAARLPYLLNEHKNESSMKS